MAPEVAQLGTCNFTCKLPEDEAAVEQSMVDLEPDIEIPHWKETTVTTKTLVSEPSVALNEASAKGRVAYMSAGACTGTMSAP